MFNRKTDESVNGTDSSVGNSDGEIFGSPSFCPRDLSAQRHVVSPTGLDVAQSKPLETFRKDGFHHGDSNEESNVLKKLESIKLWSLNTLKCTKQVIEEKLGTTVPTSDEKLDLRIQTLKQMQRQYSVLLDGVRQLSLNLSKTVQSQRELAGQLATLGQQQLELSDTFVHNAETQKFLTTNGEKLLRALDVVCSGLSTLVHQTFDDTMLTVRHMNIARIEFDAYRKEYEAMRPASVTTGGPNELAQRRRVDQALARFTASEANFLRLKSAVDAKMRLLHENRIRVMQHHLLLLHSATTAYSSGNVAMLDQTLKRFNVKLTSPPPKATKSTFSRRSVDLSSSKPSSPRKSTTGPS